MKFSQLIRGRMPLPTLLLSLLVAGAPGIARADDIQDRFNEAFDALNAERYYTAKKLLSDLLAEYPTLHRARLELARAEYLSSDFDAAEAEIQEVLKDPDVPPSVRTTLLAFLAQIRDDKQGLEDRHLWTGQVYGGVMYDSNVNFGVARDIVDIGGILFQVTPGSREREDGAGVLDAGLLHTYNPNIRFQSGEKTGFFLWQTQGNGYYRGYFDETDFSLGVATLRTGPTWVVPGKWRASIGLQGDQLWLGGDNLAFFTSLNPSATWYLDESRTEISAGLTLADRNYKRTIDVGRDGDVVRGGLSARRYYRDRSVMSEAGIGYTNFNADNNRFSYKAPEIFVGGAVDAWTRGNVYGRVGYRNFDFNAPDPGFSEPRDDDEWRLILGATHEIASSFLAGWIVRGEWIYTDNNSNNPLYDFDRHQVSLGLQRNF